MNSENTPAESSLTPVSVESAPAAPETALLLPALQIQLLSSLLQPPAAETPGIDFGIIGRVLRRFWPVLVLCTGLCVGAAWYYLQKTPTLYLALGEIGVVQERSELVPSAAMRGEDLKSLEMLKSIERQIAGQNVLLEVAKRFNLHHDPVLAGAKAAAGLADDEVVMALSRRVSASLERGTRNIVVHVEDSDPQRARDICQTIIDLVVQRDPGVSADLKAKAIAALEKQAGDARARVDASQAAVNAFRAKFPALPLEESPSGMKTNSFEDRLKALNTDAVRTADELSVMEAQMDRVRAAGTNINALLAVPGLAMQETVIGLRKALSEARAILAESDYGPKHPTSRAMQQRVSEITGGLQQTLLTAAKVEEAKYEKARENSARIEREIAALKEQQHKFAVVAGEFKKLGSELKATSEGYSSVLARLNEEKNNSAFGASALRVVADPLVPSTPWKPRRMLTLAAGGVAGGTLGVTLIALLMLLDRSLRSVTSTERLLRMPCLTTVPRVKLGEGRGRLIYGSEQDSPAAEAIRSLRASLGTAGRVPGARSFLFTSARTGEGKTTVAVNFAASLAQQGYRTLIIDANLRAPVLDEVLLGQRSESGLADYLSGEFSADAKLCRQTERPNLFLFSAGVTGAHPAEILSEPAFARLIKESLKWFHRVVIDTSPAGQFADTLPLARHADAVCFVVRAGKTRRSEAVKAVNRLASAGTRPAGFVLNAAPETAMQESYAADFAPAHRAPALFPALPAARA